MVLDYLTGHQSVLFMASMLISNVLCRLSPPFDVIIISYVHIAEYVINLYSDHGGDGSVFSGDKSFDEPPWGTFDTNDDVDSVWGFNPVSTSKVCKFLLIGKFHPMFIEILLLCLWIKKNFIEILLKSC